MKTEIYDIGGMHCAACSEAVSRVTRKLPGVAECEVNLLLNRMKVEYDEKLTSEGDIVAKVEKAGFTAELHTQNRDKAASAVKKKKTDEREKQEKKEKTELTVSLCFAGLLFAFSMGHMIFPFIPVPELISPQTHPVNFALVQLLLCIPVLFSGRKYYINGIGAIFRGSPNMDTLVALSSAASFIYSIAMMFLLTDSPERVHSLYFESAGIVVALVSLGKYLESRSKAKTADAITGLMKLSPDTAVLVRDGKNTVVPLSEIRVGDTVLVKSGAGVPLDGIVVSGSGEVDESMLTGESLPVTKGEGSEVTGGSMALDGAMFVRVSRVGSDGTLAKIIKFVEDAQGKKAPISKVADKVAGVFVPIVIAVAILAAAVWLVTGAEFAFALKIFTTVLVIACPCAMGLATPTAIIVGTGLGAKHGILVRSGEALEAAEGVTTVIFDKTGTVTSGKPEVSDVFSQDEKRMFEVLYSLEKLSGHPLAGAVCEYAENSGVHAEAQTQPGELETISGGGLCARLPEGTAVAAGNERLMEKLNIDIAAYAEKIKLFRSQGKSVIITAVADKALGVVALSDTVRADAASAVAVLKKQGIKTVLLTGDNRQAAEYIGAMVGIGEIEAEVLPEEKAGTVKAYQDKGERVMMVGDGINDAPALTQADVGCAVGGGSDIAIDSADVVLLRPGLGSVPETIKLSRLTLRNIKQNLFWAFIYNILGIPLAAGVLYPAFGILLSPMIGAAAMSLSSVFVVTNALRLKNKRIEETK